jgi:lipoprotein LprG
MSARPRRLVPLAARWLALGLALTIAGCTSAPPSTPTPTAVTSAARALTQAELLTGSAAAMKAVTSAHFTLTVAGQLPDLQVQGAEGDLTSAGNAKGTAKIIQFGQLVQVDFVIVGKDLYIKGPTGGFTKIPAAMAGAIYDPTAILSPDKGVAKVLGSVTKPATPVVAGSSYHVTGTVPKAAAAPLVPGIASDVAGTFTIDKISLRSTEVLLRLKGSDGKPATVDLALSDFNKTVAVSAPA